MPNMSVYFIGAPDRENFLIKEERFVGRGPSASPYHMN